MILISYLFLFFVLRSRHILIVILFISFLCLFVHIHFLGKMVIYIDKLS